jgi:hypothetical protein
MIDGVGNHAGEWVTGPGVQIPDGKAFQPHSLPVLIPFLITIKQGWAPLRFTKSRSVLYLPAYDTSGVCMEEFAVIIYRNRVKTNLANNTSINLKETSLIPNKSFSYRH